MSAPVVNFKIGNEKLIRVLEGASKHLRGLLDKQGRPEGALRIAVVG
ncbi:MAG: iron-sulfur cluster assembly accessory protein, partial [Verrucomicrobiales bacterium VVV1]